jgi:hypothetical protein
LDSGESAAAGRCRAKLTVITDAAYSIFNLGSVEEEQAKLDALHPVRNGLFYAIVPPGIGFVFVMIAWFAGRRIWNGFFPPQVASLLLLALAQHSSAVSFEFSPERQFRPNARPLCGVCVNCRKEWLLR